MEKKNLERKRIRWGRKVIPVKKRRLLPVNNFMGNLKSGVLEWGFRYGLL